MTEPALRSVSFGGGVQSTTLLLMADRGLIAEGAKPDVAIFADTGWEPPHVYDTVDTVRDLVSFPVVTVGTRNLADDLLAGVGYDGKPFVTVPVHIRNLDGKRSLNKRQCTTQYKIIPIKREIRRQMGLSPRDNIRKGVWVEQWLGISTDESTRMKDSQVQYIRNRYPLVEADLSRSQCAEWLKTNYPTVPVGKSACMGCPYHSQTAWVELAQKYPKEMAQTVVIDKAIRHKGQAHVEYFLHPSHLPLDKAIEMQQNTPSLFDEECEGMCFL